MHPLFLKYFNQTITPLEKEALFDAIDKDPALQEEFVQMQAYSSLAALLPATAVQQASAPVKRRHLLRATPRWMRYAAAAVLLLLSTWGLVATLHPAQGLFGDDNWVTLTAMSGQRISITLQDGTQVWLNSNSTLAYPKQFAQDTRKVVLDGEAYFDVAPNKRHPFVVSTQKYDIEVLGTEFNVLAYKDSPMFKTSLIEGAVKIYDPGNKAIALHLTPSQEAVLSDGELLTSSFTDTEFLRWKEGIYAFDDCTFAQIIDQLQWYYGVPIRIENNSLEHFRLSGKFRQQDGLENALKNMQRVTPFKFKKDTQSDTLIIK